MLYNGCVCPWVTRLHMDRCLFGRSVQKCVPLNTRHCSKAGLRPLQGSAPWQARSHGHAPSQHIGYIRFTALPERRGSKICLKISASKLGGGVSPLSVSRIQYGIATCAVCLPFYNITLTIITPQSVVD